MPRRREPLPSPAEEAPFLAAIRDTPDDDAPRLVFADWLEERGDGRADLIRVQCRLARTELDDDARGPLVERERELLQRHARRWLTALPAVEGLTWGIESMELDACNTTPIAQSRPVVFVRGVPALATLERSTLWDQAIHQQTCASQFHVLRDGNLLAESAAPPGFWDWCEGMVGDGVELPLIERQHYPRLERLAIHLPSQAAVEALARTEMPRLRWLRLTSPVASRQPESWVVPYSSFRRLQDWHSLEGLRSLDVTTGIAGTELELLRSPHLTQLRELRSTGGRYGADLQYVVTAPKFSRLVRLAISITLNAGMDDAQAFCRSTNLTKLEHLEIIASERMVPEDILSVLLSATNVPRLRSLVLNAFRPQLRTDMPAELLRPLRILWLSHVHWADDDVAALCSPELWPPQLEELYLGGNCISDEGAMALAAQPGVARLRVLDLEENEGYLSSAARHALWNACGKALKL